MITELGKFDEATQNSSHPGSLDQQQYALVIG
jgi:hypothetical protein